LKEEEVRKEGRKKEIFNIIMEEARSEALLINIFYSSNFIVLLPSYVV
jgi:hypothetical protein